MEILDPPKKSLSASQLCHMRTRTHTSSPCGHTEGSFSELISSSALRYELWGPWRISVAGKDNHLLLMELEGLFLFLTVPGGTPPPCSYPIPPSSQLQLPGSILGGDGDTTH